MSVPSAYFTSTKNVPGMLAAIQKAGVPDKFTHTFLKNLGFTSSSDRPVIPMLKALGFLDDSGVPTERYRRYKDTPRAPGVLAEALRDAYADLFVIDQRANDKSVEDLRGMFARLSEKGDSVVAKMAGTFKVLADLADFEVDGIHGDSEAGEETSRPVEASDEQLGGKVYKAEAHEVGTIAVHHDIHVHLPTTTDIAVYHAIFKSLRENFP